MISGDNRIEAGMLAVSRAGHDCGKTYVIIKADSRFVWLADGKSAEGFRSKEEKPEAYSGDTSDNDTAAKHSCR